MEILDLATKENPGRPGGKQRMIWRMRNWSETAIACEANHINASHILSDLDPFEQLVKTFPDATHHLMGS